MNFHHQIISLSFHFISLKKHMIFRVFPGWSWLIIMDLFPVIYGRSPAPLEAVSRPSLMASKLEPRWLLSQIGQIGPRGGLGIFRCHSGRSFRAMTVIPGYSSWDFLNLHFRSGFWAIFHERNSIHWGSPRVRNQHLLLIFSLWKTLTLPGWPNLKAAVQEAWWHSLVPFRRPFQGGSLSPVVQL